MNQEQNLKSFIEKAKYIFSYENSSSTNIELFIITNEIIYLKNNNEESLKESSELAKKVWEYINLHMGTIENISIKDGSLPHIKDSTHHEIRITVNQKQYLITRKTNDEIVNSFFDKFIDEIKKIIN